MSLYPDVQRKAQAELDRVVGPDRLPDFNHLDELVYIQAVALETMRWAVVTPLANPHRLLRDDEFNGFFIPKGTTVLPVGDTFVRLFIVVFHSPNAHISFRMHGKSFAPASSGKQSVC